MGRIDWPIFESEFEVQAELYFKLRSSGLKVRGSVFGYGEEEITGGFTCWLDLVVFSKDQKPLCIIECKTQKKDKGNGTVMFSRCNTRQYRRYKSFGLPVFQCVCLAQVPSTLAAVSEFIEKRKP